MVDRLGSPKPGITKKIKLLHTQIDTIEKKLESSKQNVEKLEGRWAAKIPLLGTLIKIFYKWYNSNLLNQEHKNSEAFRESKSKYEKEIEALQLSLSSLKEVKIPHAEVFEIENQMRMALEKDFPEKEKYQNLYRQILPFVEQAKQSITKKPFHFAAQAAAAKGKAAQAGLQALKNLTENSPVITNSGISSQEIFLLPEEGAVFKVSSERAEEEERLVNDLFDLMSKQAVVGTFHIQKTSAQAFGIQVPQEILTRGVTVEELSPKLQQKIKQKLSSDDHKVLEKYEKTPPLLDAAFINYQQVEKEKWSVQFPDEEEFKTLSLKNCKSSI